MSEEKSEKLEKVGNFVSSTFNKIINLIIFLIITGLLLIIAWFWHESQMDKQEIKSLKKENIELREELKGGGNKDLEVKKVDDSKNVGDAESMNNNVSENKEITQEKVTENSSDIPADWKTYTNENYGFEIKIPSDWIVEEFKNNNGKIGNYSQLYFYPKYRNSEIEKNKAKEYCFRNNISVDYCNLVPKELYFTDDPFTDLENEDLQYKVVNGIKIYSYELSERKPFWNYLIQVGNKRVYRFEMSNTKENKKKLDNIISTFRFLQ